MRSLGRLTLAALVITPALAAQSTGRHPDFTGVWVLDLARSESSSFNPKAATFTVMQHGDSLVVDRETASITGDMVKTHSVYGIDGKPWTNILRLVGQETTATSVLSWSGDSLVIRTTSTPGDKELLQVDAWTLSPDGRTMRMKRSATYDNQPVGAPTWTLTKQ